MTAARSASELSEIAEPVLIALAREGDAPAFGEIVRRRHSRVRNFMRYLCRHPDEGDDLAQQVFVKAWRSIGQLRTPAAFDGWLKKIMVTTWLEEKRRNKIAYDGERDLDANPSPNESPKKKIDLDSALARLPAAMRLSVVLAYYNGMTHQEIASMTEIPLGTVKSNISRGSARLRELLYGYRERRRD